MGNGIIIIDTYRRLGWVLLSFLTFLTKVFFAQSGQVRTVQVQQLVRRENVKATTWRRPRGSDNLEGEEGRGGRREEETKMKIQKYAIALPQSPALISVRVPKYTPSFIFDATTWKRQSGSDNLEATTCDPYRFPHMPRQH